MVERRQEMAPEALRGKSDEEMEFYLSRNHWPSSAAELHDFSELRRRVGYSPSIDELRECRATQVSQQ